MESSLYKYKLSLGTKLILANTLIIIFGGLATGWIDHIHPFPDQTIIAGLALACIAVTAVDWLVLKRAFRPLVAFRREIETEDQSPGLSVAAVADPDANLGGVVRSVKEKLQRVEDDSRWYSMQLLNSIEIERKRIGRELHDQVSQTLATALLHLKKSENTVRQDPAESLECVATAMNLIEHSIREIRNCVYDLRPVMLDDFGLVPTLRWHIQAHFEKTGIKITEDFEDGSMRAPRDIETVLYRVAQEALANAIRHAKATRIFIGLEIKPEYAALKISDNGMGFDSKQASRYARKNSGGSGLHIMRERIKLANGTINIESEKGAGTRIHIVVPIPSDAVASPNPSPE